LDASLVSQLKDLLNLGWPAIATAAAWVFWRAYAASAQARIDDMKELLKSDIQDIRARVLVIENEVKLSKSVSAFADVIPKKGE